MYGLESTTPTFRADIAKEGLLGSTTWYAKRMSKVVIVLAIIAAILGRVFVDWVMVAIIAVIALALLLYYGTRKSALLRKLGKHFDDVDATLAEIDQQLAHDSYILPVIGPEETMNTPMLFTQDWMIHQKTVPTCIRYSNVVAMSLRQWSSYNHQSGTTYFSAAFFLLDNGRTVDITATENEYLLLEQITSDKNPHMILETSLYLDEFSEKDPLPLNIGDLTKGQREMVVDEYNRRKAEISGANQG